MIGYLICALLVLALQIVTGWWWWVLVVPFGWFLVRRARMRTAVITGAAATGSVWLAWSVYMWVVGGADLIARRVAEAMQIEAPIGLILAATLVALIAGGLGAAAGASLRGSIKRSP